MRWGKPRPGLMCRWPCYEIPLSLRLVTIGPTVLRGSTDPKWGTTAPTWGYH
jgi:hypothetical protein